MFSVHEASLDIIGLPLSEYRGWVAEREAGHRVSAATPDTSVSVGDCLQTNNNHNKGRSFGPKRHFASQGRNPQAF